MSEYQYYEFHSIDRMLSEKEQAEIDTWSSRASPTSRSVSFTYNYGDFSRDEKKVVLKYFDAGFYYADWGTKRLLFRLPADLVDLKTLQKYDYGEEYEFSLEISGNKEYVLIDMYYQEDGGFSQWIEGEGTLPTLLSLRDDLLKGDYRCLFLFWLSIKKMDYDIDDLKLDEKIPANMIPPNLKKLNTGLKNLIDFFEMDMDWINSVAAYSEDSTIKEEKGDDALKQIQALPQKLKDDYLLRLVKGEINLDYKFKKELKTKKATSNNKSPEVSFSTLIGQSNEVEQERIAAQKEKERKAHLKKLKEVEANKERTLASIQINITQGNSKSYDEALQEIISLKELAIHKKEEAEFQKYIDGLKKKYSRKSSLIRRFRENDL